MKTIIEVDTLLDALKDQPPYTIKDARTEFEEIILSRREGWKSSYGPCQYDGVEDTVADYDLITSMVIQHPEYDTHEF